ncbi:MAG: fumarylacetoacetate hydrolase family protein [Clostridiales bacterium]|nr:fumarylacetoacetate hydrolase family protein [Clostridiales bacterium]
MKFVRIIRDGVPVWGEVKGEAVFTLEAPPYERIRYDGESLPLASCRLLAPCTPTKIVCVGKNYHDHAMEMGGEVPEAPLLFLKAPNCINHPEGRISAPAYVTRLDYEGELAVVIKKRAKCIPAADAAAYILGYTCLNDVTARDIQAADGQWTRAKGMDGFAPMGPWVTDEVDAANLNIETRLCGRTVQSSNSARFMTKIPELLEFITRCMTLEPGDVIATGTPAGIGPMKPGDVVEIEIEGIGILRNYIAEPY